VCIGEGWKPTIAVAHSIGKVVSTSLGDEGIKERLQVTGQPTTLRSVVEKTKPHAVIISFDTRHWESFLENTQPSLFRPLENEPRKTFFLVAAKGIHEAVRAWASRVEAVEVHTYTRVGVARVSREARGHILARLRAWDTSIP
jgi:metallophosphoesterase superfamily enzyme